MKPFVIGLNVFSEAIYLLHLQHQTRLSEHILAIFTEPTVQKILH